MARLRSGAIPRLRRPHTPPLHRLGTTTPPSLGTTIRLHRSHALSQDADTPTRLAHCPMPLPSTLLTARTSRRRRIAQVAIGSQADLNEPPCLVTPDVLVKASILP